MRLVIEKEEEQVQGAVKTKEEKSKVQKELAKAKKTVREKDKEVAKLKQEV